MSTASGRGRGFVELFQQRAQLAPDAVAVVHGGRTMSYGELDRCTDRLAHVLRGLGAGPESTVGVLTGRSPRLAVAILGTLKAGAAYVPLDPAHPVERQVLMLADCAATVLLTESGLGASLPADGVPRHVVALDSPESAAAPDGPDGSRPAWAPALHTAAYVVYTSGSTGRPKGAVIEHGSLVRFAGDIVDRLGLTAADRFLQFASPAFDVLVEELFPTWLAGGAVVIPAGHILSGGVDLVDVVARDRVTVMELPTAYWHEWVRELDRTGRTLPSCLRLVVIGGERVLSRRLQMWHRHGVPLAHVYGLTETTVSSTFFHLDPGGPPREWPNLPIGSAIPSADVRVLDRRLRRVPRGGTGEIYIGGVSVARGYLGKPGLTAQRFVADPDPGHPGERLYRTGDLARRRPDGDLEFLSRVDTQIKIRGFRVEPTEVESVLGDHPRVAECVVTLHSPAEGEPRLVAYVVPAGGVVPDVTELRRHLEVTVPSHMVPAAFVALEALPLNANGKVDHARLPEPEATRPELAQEYREPVTDVQRRLADVVSSVVGVSRVGLDDNFFEIGGDSILAIQVVARAQEAGLTVTPYEVFAHPTVAALAEALAAGRTVDAQQGEVTGPVPLTPGVQRFCGAGLAEPHHWNDSVLLELAASVDPAVLRSAVEVVLRQHDGLRQRFLFAGTRNRARIAPAGGEAPLDVHDLSGLDGTRQDEEMVRLLGRAQRSLDLAVGPLVRVTLFRLGESRRDRVVIVVHRLVADLDSMRLVLADLETAIVQLTAGEELRLLPKTTSWQAWARRLQSFARSDEVLAAAAPAEAATPAPSGVADDLGTHGTSQSLRRTMDAADTEALLELVGRRLDRTPEEVLLAGLSRALAAVTGVARHMIDVERDGRRHDFDGIDISRTVGWFTRTHPIGLACAADEEPRVTLDTVAAAVRAVPLAGLVRDLQAAEAGPRAPRAWLRFAWEGVTAAPPTGAFTVLAHPAGQDRSPTAPRSYAVEARARVSDATLVVTWTFAGGDASTCQVVDDLADRHLAEVRRLVREAAGDGEQGRRGFPLARVDEAQLADLLSRL